MRKYFTFIGLFLILTLLYKSTSVSLYARIFLPFAPLVNVMVLSGISAYFLTVLSELTVTKKLHFANVLAFYLLYFAFLVYTLFAPHRGLYGLNLNPFNMFTSPQDPLIVGLNFLLFAPIGFLLKLRWRNLLIMAILIFGVEATQYLLKLGYADIDDWLSNMISFVLGTQLIKIPQRLGVKLSLRKN